MSIFKDLARSRKAAGMTQAELAAAGGLSRMTVQRIESEEIDPRWSTLQEMARALGLEPMLVPAALRDEVEAFLRSSGRMLAQPPGAGAPPSVIDALLKGNRP